MSRPQLLLLLLLLPGSVKIKRDPPRFCLTKALVLYCLRNERLLTEMKKRKTASWGLVFAS